MKRKLNSSFIIMLVLLVTACTQHRHDAANEIYTCPMHPAITADAPGTCPVCGMELVRKVSESAAVPVTPDLATLTLSANEKVKSSISTLRGEYRSMPVTLEAKGTVAYDTRYVRTIPSRVGGRLEKVYLRYYYQQVKQGQKVAEIYSPELVAAQRELLYLAEHDATNTELLTLAKNRLHLLGLTEKQVQQVLNRKEAFYAIPVLSPVEGYLVPAITQTTATAQGPQPSAGSSMDGMPASQPQANAADAVLPQTTTGAILREGDYVTAGETLFRLASASALRVELNLPAAQATSIRTGTAVKLDFENGNTEQASVDLVQPFFEEGEAFVKIRVYTRNTGDLHIGHFVQATLTVDPHESLWLPRDAVLDLGLDRVVFVKSNDMFSARKVETGIRTKDWIEIRQGLASADEVAANAHYLVDSDSFIKPANEP